MLLWDLARGRSTWSSSATTATADANPDLWPTGDDDEDLGTWAAAFTRCWRASTLDAELAGEEDLDFAAPRSLMLPMFLARVGAASPSPTLQSVDPGAMATEHLEDPDAAWDAWVAEHGHPATACSARLAEHGAVEVDEETARLTPLGHVVHARGAARGRHRHPAAAAAERADRRRPAAAVAGMTTDEELAS